MPARDLGRDGRADPGDDVAVGGDGRGRRPPPARRRRSRSGVATMVSTVAAERPRAQTTRPRSASDGDADERQRPAEGAADLGGRIAVDPELGEVVGRGGHGSEYTPKVGGCRPAGAGSLPSRLETWRPGDFGVIAMVTRGWSAAAMLAPSSRRCARPPRRDHRSQETPMPSTRTLPQFPSRRILLARLLGVGFVLAFTACDSVDEPLAPAGDDLAAPTPAAEEVVGSASALAVPRQPAPRLHPQAGRRDQHPALGRLPDGRGRHAQALGPLHPLGVRYHESVLVARRQAPRGRGHLRRHP